MEDCKLGLDERDRISVRLVEGVIATGNVYHLHPCAPKRRPFTEAGQVRGFLFAHDTLIHFLPLLYSQAAAHLSTSYRPSTMPELKAKVLELQVDENAVLAISAGLQCRTEGVLVVV